MLNLYTNHSTKAAKILCTLESSLCPEGPAFVQPGFCCFLQPILGNKSVSISSVSQDSDALVTGAQWTCSQSLVLGTSMTKGSTNCCLGNFSALKRGGSKVSRWRSFKNTAKESPGKEGLSHWERQAWKKGPRGVD